MARSIWKGAIAFGLVKIPVGLTSVESRPDIQLHMVDSQNHARIRYERVNAGTGEEVPWDRMVKGYVKGLISLAQFGAVEFHPWGAPLPEAEKPDFLTWDLDPDDTVPWDEALGAALLLRDYLAERGLSPMVMTSGGKGLHIMLHVKRTQEWEVMKAFAKAVAVAIAEFNPNRFTITSSKSKRGGKIYIDWLCNGRGATCVAPWGLRARPGAAVSMLIGWDQLHEITVAGFTIQEPSNRPTEWVHLKPQTVSAKVLRDTGVI